MSRLLELMTRRARAQHELDLLRSRGRAPRSRGETAKQLVSRIRGLTAQINALRARRRREAEEAAESKRRRRTRAGSRSERPAVVLKPLGRAGIPESPRERARRLRRAARARFKFASARACATCRLAAMTRSADQWSVIDEQSWPPTGGIQGRCRDFRTDPGDELDISVWIKAGPNPPGPTYMEISIYVDGDRVYNKLLGDGSYAVPFRSPGGVVRICAYVGWPGNPPHNWDSDDRGEVTVRHRRRKPNLVALGPHIWWDGPWVGFGYRIENNKIHRGNPLVGLYYGKNHEGGTDVLLGTIRERRTSRDDGATEYWDNNHDTYRVRFEDMGLPPEEATHLACFVDPEYSVDELHESDNINWHDLPKWAGLLEWVIAPPTTVPSSIPWSESGNESGRLVEVQEIRLRVRQEIWRRLVPAQERCSLRIYVSRKRRNDSDPPRGWIFPQWMRDQLQGSRINIGNDVVVHENHPPVNEFVERTNPKGARNSQSAYLFVPCSRIDRGTGEFTLYYIPPNAKGTDEIRVELWDDVRGEPIHRVGSSDPATIMGTIRSTSDFSLTWRAAPPDTVRASVLLNTSRPEADQPHRYAAPYKVTAIARLNGRPLSVSHAVRVRIVPFREQQPGEGNFVLDNSSPRGWIYPEKQGKRLGSKPISIKRDKGALVSPLKEPMKPEATRGVLNKRQQYYDVTLDERGRATFWILPPGVSGEDEIILRLVGAGKTAAKKRKFYAEIRKRVRVLRHKVPTIFVPGIMGSRIAMTHDGEEYTWAPDKEAQMLRWAARGVELSRLVLHHTNPSRVLENTDQYGDLSPEDDPEPSDDESGRGYAGLFLGYIGALRHFHGARYDLEPFDRVVHGVGYDFRKSNRRSGELLAQAVQRILGSEKDALGNAATHFTLISHSMGGLVSRSMLLERPDLAERCLSVVHGFQPAAGAVVAFRRMFTGFTLDTSTIPDQLLRQVVGDDHLKYTTITSGVLGGFELLPANTYPSTWLFIDRLYAGNDPPTPMPPSITTTLYRTEAYGVISRPGFDDTDPVLLRQELGDRVDQSESFHARLGLYFLPNRTWAVFGSGVETDVELQLIMDGDRVASRLPIRRAEGDGTVPQASGSVLFPTQLTHIATSTPSNVLNQLRVEGVEHQAGWDSADARRFAVEAIRWCLGGATEPFPTSRPK